MNSDICRLNNELINLNIMLQEVEKFTQKNGLNKKEALRIRLLAEELRGMLPGLVENFEGFFWLENEGRNYELHVEFDVEKMSLDKREKLISVATSGKNEATKGIMGKVRAVAETMILAIADSGVFYQNQYCNARYMNMGVIYADVASSVDGNYLCSWSLNNYKNEAYKEKLEEDTDELEHSIVANLADDIIVAVKGKFVEITIKKTI